MDVEFDEDLAYIEEIELGEIRPYMYEPLVNETVSRDRSDTDSNESEEELQEEDDPVNLSGTEPENWCCCNRCTRMPTLLECGCCHDKPEILTRIDGSGLQCITQHEGFVGNCLNMHVIEVSFYEYLESHGYPVEGEEIHETYRYVAYRRFVRWIWKKLPRNHRKVLPSCVVTAIREAFPSEEYCGFKYPRM